MVRSALLLLFALTACASQGPSATGVVGEPRAPHDPRVARDLAYTHRYEIRFGDDTAVAGYLVEFFRVPDGIVDERLYRPRTVLIQDRDLRNLGFITPGSHAFVFDEQGRAHDHGYGPRNTQVSAIFGRTQPPRFRQLPPIKR